MPPDGHRLFRGYAADRSSDMKTGLDSEMDAISAVPDFGAPTERWFPWNGGPTSGRSGWASSCHGATTPPSNEQSETVCSKPSARPSTITAARSS